MFLVPVRDGLTLRLYQESHAEELFNLVVANRDHLNQWLPWPDSHKTVDDALTFIRRSRDQYAQQQINMGIWEQGRLVGGIGTHLINKTERNVSIGYWLAADACGRGIMTACCETLLAYCFSELDLHRVWLEAAEGNLPSQAVARRIGMTQEGLSRESHCVRGTWLTMTVWSILRPEWDTRQRSA